MKDNGNISEENYSKDVGIGAFILEWIPFSIVGVLFFSCLWIVADIVYYTLVDKDFTIRDYFSGSVLLDPIEILCIVSIVFFLVGVYRYWQIRRIIFASITGEKLILNFGRNSFLWSNIQAVDLEGERKLIITFADKEKRKKRKFDLKWLLRKEDFILNLKDNCTEKNIPFHESELSFFW